jgi:hypothetical protein
MALLSYTFAQLQAIALEAVGSNSRADNTPADIVNDAIQYLATLHPWTWRQKSLSLDLTEDVAYVALPADFGEEVTLYYAASSETQLQPATLGRIHELRAAGDLVDQTSGRLHYAIEHVPQASAAALPTVRLALWPTPTAAVTGAIAGVYRRQLAKLSGSTDVADMPGNFQMLLRLLVKAMAVSGIEQQRGVEWELFAQALPLYIAGDGRQQASIGPMRGAVMTQGRTTWTPTILPPA